jgi:cytoskeletal protein CcmA (bactofilin family)
MARAKERDESGTPPMISIIGAGMRVLGDCITDGTVRIEGMVTGTVFAGKAVVVGKEGTIHGDVRTEDAVISGEVTGAVLAASRLEIQSTSRIRGEIRTRRLQLEEGAVLNGEVHMGEVELGAPPLMNGSVPPTAHDAHIA